MNLKNLKKNSDYIGMDDQEMAALALNLAGITINFRIINPLLFGYIDYARIRFGADFERRINYAANVMHDYRKRGREYAIITPLAQEYPENLLRIPNPPLALFCRGNLDLLGKNPVGIVGTRKPSLVTMLWIKEISGSLSRAGIVTVSGLACGIDLQVHNHSMDTGTVAVLPHSLDYKTPSIYQGFLSNSYKSDRVLLLSEYYATDSIRKYFYIHRNRIIAGLCNSVIMAEAGIASGALITGNYAVRFNRTLYGLDNPLQTNNAGVREMIKRGLAINAAIHFPILISESLPGKGKITTAPDSAYLGNSLVLHFIKDSFSVKFLLPG